MVAKRTREANDPAFTVTSTELARLLQVHSKQITRLRLAGLPQAGKGKFALLDVLAWLQSDQGTDGNGDPSLSEARRDLAMVQKEKVEVEVRKLKNELVPYEEVRHLLMAIVQVLISGLDALPARTGARLAAMTSTPLAEDEIENECRAIREQLHASIRRFEADYQPLG